MGFILRKALSQEHKRIPHCCAQTVLPEPSDPPVPCCGVRTETGLLRATKLSCPFAQRPLLPSLIQHPLGSVSSVTSGWLRTRCAVSRVWWLPPSTYCFKTRQSSNIRQGQCATTLLLPVFSCHSHQ